MLTEKQMRFCEFYSATANGAESAIRAGYSKASARSIANALLTKVDVLAYVEKLTEQSRSDRIADADEIRAFWTATLRDSSVSDRDRLTASQLLAKSQGMFVDQSRVEITKEEEKPRVIVYLPEIEKDEEEDGE